MLQGRPKISKRKNIKILGSEPEYDEKEEKTVLINVIFGLDPKISKREEKNIIKKGESP